MLPGLSDQERLAIVNEAIRLIERPKNFIQGLWKCPLFCDPAKPEKVYAFNTGPEGGAIVPDGMVEARDEHGRPEFSYCVEGAINQAGINILGRDRAREFGAWDGTKLWGEPEPAHSASFAEYLSVNEVARILIAEMDLYHGDIENIEAPARFVNDDEGSGDEHSKEAAHHRVMKVLRRRAEQITGVSA